MVQLSVPPQSGQVVGPTIALCKRPEIVHCWMFCAGIDVIDVVYLVCETFIWLWLIGYIATYAMTK